MQLTKNNFPAVFMLIVDINLIEVFRKVDSVR